MSLPVITGGTPDLFASKRTGRAATVIEPKLLDQVTALLQKHGMVQGQEFYTATAAETDAYNDRRATAAKTAEKEAPPRLTVPAMAQRNARVAAGPLAAYIDAAIDKSFPNRSHSLRFVDQGTEDKPSVLFAYVLVPKRAARAK